MQYEKRKRNRRYGKIGDRFLRLDRNRFRLCFFLSVSELRLILQKAAPVDAGQFFPVAFVGELRLPAQKNHPGPSIQFFPGTPIRESGLNLEKIDPIITGDALSGKKFPVLPAETENVAVFLRTP